MTEIETPELHAKEDSTPEPKITESPTTVSKASRPQRVTSLEDRSIAVGSWTLEAQTIELPVSALEADWPLTAAPKEDWPLTAALEADLPLITAPQNGSRPLHITTDACLRLHKFELTRDIERKRAEEMESTPLPAQSSNERDRLDEAQARKPLITIAEVNEPQATTRQITGSLTIGPLVSGSLKTGPKANKSLTTPTQLNELEMTASRTTVLLKTKAQSGITETHTTESSSRGKEPQSSIPQATES